MTTLHINAILTLLLLAVIQLAAIWIIRPHLSILVDDQLLVAAFFSPTAGIVWCAKQFTTMKSNGLPDEIDKHHTH